MLLFQDTMVIVLVAMLALPLLDVVVLLETMVLLVWDVMSLSLPLVTGGTDLMSCSTKLSSAEILFLWLVQQNPLLLIVYWLKVQFPARVFLLLPDLVTYVGTEIIYAFDLRWHQLFIWPCHKVNLDPQIRRLNFAIYPLGSSEVRLVYRTRPSAQHPGP